MTTLRRTETFERAINLLHDLEFFKSLKSKQSKTRSELRQLGVIARRIFLQQAELKRVADVRVDNFRISVPDLEPIYLFSESGRLVFFACGGASIFGVYASNGMVIRGDHSQAPNGFDPRKLTNLTINKFLDQKVIYWRNVWFKRNEIIEFVSNKLGGAHTGKISNKKEKLLKDLCFHGKIHEVNGVGNFELSVPSTELKSAHLKLTNSEIDILLFELFSCFHYLFNSASLQELIIVINDEKT